MIQVRVPASTANLGPGFDVLGAGLSLYLTLTLELSNSTTLHYSGDSPELISLDPAENFITKIMQFMSNCFRKELPTFKLTIENPIPLGRGLGSSGSAVVAAVQMANELLDLNLTKNQVLDFSTMVEGHPDNVGGSIFGWNVSYSRAKLPEFNENWFLKGAQVETPQSILEKTRTNWHMGESHSSPIPLTGNLISMVQLKVNPAIKCVVAIPKFTLATSKARQVLPANYPRSDAVFNMGRLAALTTLLCSPNLNHKMINESMHDGIHQPFRAPLVPGLLQVLKLTPQDVDGLLGVCLSGAGPTVLALAVSNFETIGKKLVDIFTANRVDSTFMILDFDQNGVQVSKSE